MFSDGNFYSSVCHVHIYLCIKFFYEQRNNNNDNNNNNNKTCI